MDIYQKAQAHLEAVDPRVQSVEREGDTLRVLVDDEGAEVYVTLHVIDVQRVADLYDEAN